MWSSAAAPADGDVTMAHGRAAREHRHRKLATHGLNLDAGDVFTVGYSSSGQPRHTSMPALSGVACFHRRDPSSSSQQRYSGHRLGQPDGLHVHRVAQSHLPPAPSGAKQPISSG